MLRISIISSYKTEDIYSSDYNDKLYTKPNLSYTRKSGIFMTTHAAQIILIIGK